MNLTEENLDMKELGYENFTVDSWYELSTDVWYLIENYEEYDQDSGVLTYQYLELERDIGYFDAVDPPFKIDGNYTIDIGIKMFESDEGPERTFTLDKWFNYNLDHAHDLVAGTALTISAFLMLFS